MKQVNQIKFYEVIGSLDVVVSAAPGRHLGRRIAFVALPAKCQAVVNYDLETEGV